MAAKTNIQAESLNASFDALGKKFDGYFSQIPVQHKKLIQKTLSDWQDWYFSEVYGEWPSGPLVKWNEAYNLANDLINKDIKEKKLKAKEARVYEASKVIEIKQPLVVYGRVPRAAVLAIMLAGASIGSVIYYSAK